MTRRHAVVALGVLALTAIGATLVWWQHVGTAHAVISLKPSDPDVVALGGSIYAQHCGSCHGANLEGQPDWQLRLENGRLPAPPHDETGHTWHHSDRVIFDLTKYGPAAVVGTDYESDMPGFENTLSDHEIIAALSYIKSRWPEKLQERHDQLNTRKQN